ncbi:Tn3 family transposase [Citrobacter sp. CFSAN044567]|uniref:Tn3 family transposase n=1 Tax=Citrobacter sp. CFSAN044567 TaxID=1897730 RepID=UPI002100F3CD|nr:Tn3 family transposase [Citrobacter sp. CFSAN044567]
MQGTQKFEPVEQTVSSSRVVTNLEVAKPDETTDIAGEHFTHEAGKPVDGELLQFLSPLGWEHINLTGDYVWRQSRRLEDGKFRPLRMPGKP